MQGVVMKITETKLVVFCGDGKFRNLPLPQVMPALGETILVPEVSSVPLPVLVPLSAEPKKRLASKPLLYKGWIAAACFLVLLTASLLFNGSGIFHQPVAMVAIDINPSVELFLDDQRKVEEVSTLNDDAEKMLEDANLVGMDFYDAMNVILSKAEEQGYLQAGTDKTMIMMAVVDYTDHPFQVDLTQLSSAQSYDIALNYLDTDQQEKAEQAKLSLNKYLIYDKAQLSGNKLDVEELRELSIATAIARSGLNLNSFISQGWKLREQAKPEKSDKMTDQGHWKNDETLQPSDEDNGKGKEDDGADSHGDRENGKNQNSKANKQGQGNKGVTEQNKNNQEEIKERARDQQDDEKDKRADDNKGTEQRSQPKDKAPGSTSDSEEEPPVTDGSSSDENEDDGQTADPDSSDYTAPNTSEDPTNSETQAPSTSDTSSTDDSSGGPSQSKPVDRKGN